MVGRGTSEVVALRHRVQILEHTVWVLVERVTALEERALGESAGPHNTPAKSAPPRAGRAPKRPEERR